MASLGMQGYYAHNLPPFRFPFNAHQVIPEEGEEEEEEKQEKEVASRRLGCDQMMSTRTKLKFARSGIKLKLAVEGF